MNNSKAVTLLGSLLAFKDKYFLRLHSKFYVFLFLHNVDGDVVDVNSLMIEER